MTPNGFKKFDGLSQNFKRIIKLILENDSELECSENHQILTNSGFKEFNQLTFDDLIKTDIGYLKIKDSTLITLENEEVFDLINVEDINSYYTNGIVSHNCVFGDTKITIRDKETGIVFDSSMEDFYKKL